MSWLRLLGAALLLGVLAVASPTARESSGTPAARAFFAEGEAEAKAGKYAGAAAAFRKAIEADPDFVEAHQRFIESTQRQEAPASRTPTVPRLQQLYERWAKQYPKRAAYQWALGFLSHEPDTADVFFKKALAIDPGFARAHVLLAKNADIRGDWTAQREHLKAAVDANPDEPRYVLKYAQALQEIDPAHFRELASEVLRKFPATQAAAEALYRLAEAASDPERRAYFERLRTEYPAGAYGYGSSAMYDFYDELTIPSEALSVARDMAKVFPSSKTWARRVALQEAMARTQALVAERNFADALELLEKTERPSGAHGATWTLLKAEAAAAAGHSELAYAALVDSVAAMPDDRVEEALVKYGTAANKTRPQIDADVWRIRDAKAVPAVSFQLPASRGSAPVQLSDYRGRVVLLAFWFPG